MAAISDVSEHNKELVNKYQKAMELRNKYFYELVKLIGHNQVFRRVHLLRFSGS
ncbi:hypothetical protein DPMN_008594 [Dreissena polymorpha]|uniref:Uncharacterized protein n=1 Tax=Dreissena polymorpha TaxID=45954 RepID=A0A9D4RX45_DREPO|nr:hypothetical protein DPMN_008594 [Dreissena polymorpha]